MITEPTGAKSEVWVSVRSCTARLRQLKVSPPKGLPARTQFAGRRASRVTGLRREMVAIGGDIACLPNRRYSPASFGTGVGSALLARADKVTL